MNGKEGPRDGFSAVAGGYTNHLPTDDASRARAEPQEDRRRIGPSSTCAACGASGLQIVEVGRLRGRTIRVCLACLNGLQRKAAARRGPAVLAVRAPA